jgi:uncharacterized protein YacL (UPF0231 family)
MDSQAVRNFIFQKTVYNNGTHYVISTRLTSEVLEEISDSENVLEVAEKYIGSTASVRVSHEHAEVWIRGLSVDECV